MVIRHVLHDQGILEFEGRVVLSVCKQIYSKSSLLGNVDKYDEYGRSEGSMLQLYDITRRRTPWSKYLTSNISNIHYRITWMHVLKIPIRCPEVITSAGAESQRFSLKASHPYDDT